MAVPSSSMTGCSVVLEVPRSAWASWSEIAPELRRKALVVAALVDDRLAHGRGQAPADQILRRVAERAEDEEVEDDDRQQRRERDRNPASDESCAHSSVHSRGSVLL